MDLLDDLVEEMLKKNVLQTLIAACLLSTFCYLACQDDG